MTSDVVDEMTTNGTRNRMTLEADELYKVLADRHRRTALRYLLVEERTVTVDELHAAVTAADSTDADAASGANVVRMRLFHAHLPLLDDLDVIDYRADEEIVVPKPAINEFKAVLHV